MSDITALFGFLLIFALTFPALLFGEWLLFPATVARARVRLEQTPWRCFWLGGVVLALLVIPIVILLALPFGPAKFAGAALIAATLFFSSFGAAGLAAKMGAQLTQHGPFHPAGAFLRGALALELGLFFPVLGWFFAFPLITITNLGAATFALLRWAPRPLPNVVPTPALPSER